VIFLAAVGLCAAFAEEVGLLPFEEAWLPGGLHVVAHAVPSSTRAALHLRLPGGASLDPPGRAGRAHLLEHLAFTGTELVPGGGYDRLLAGVGGSSGGWTTRDALVLTAEVPDEALPLALALERDRLRGLQVSADALAAQRAVVARERVERARSTAVDRLLARSLWPADHPYGRSVLGTDESLAAITADELRAAWARITRLHGILLVIVAPRPAAALLELARATFADLGGAEGVRHLPPLAPSPAPRGRQWARDDVSPPRVRVAWRLPLLPPGDAAALDLFCELVAPRLPPGVGIRRWEGAAGGELVIGGLAERPEALLLRIRAAVRDTLRSGLTPGALSAAAARQRTRELLALEMPSERASSLAECAAQHSTADCLPQRWAARAASSPATVAEVSGRLVPLARALTVVLTGPDGPPVAGATRLEWP
jgi:predicted Zn-dependent peptidase